MSTYGRAKKSLQLYGPSAAVVFAAIALGVLGTAATMADIIHEDPAPPPQPVLDCSHMRFCCRCVCWASEHGGGCCLELVLVCLGSPCPSEYNEQCPACGGGGGGGGAGGWVGKDTGESGLGLRRGDALAFLVSLPADMVVCPDGSGHFTTLEEAVQYANAGDIIEYCPEAFMDEDGGDTGHRCKVIVGEAKDLDSLIYIYYEASVTSSAAESAMEQPAPRAAEPRLQSMETTAVSQE